MVDLGVAAEKARESAQDELSRLAERWRRAGRLLRRRCPDTFFRQLAALEVYIDDVVGFTGDEDPEDKISS